MIKFTDKAEIGKRSTKDGYLVAMSKVARTGVQDYLASELGMIGNHVVRVNRPEAEVFAKDAMASLTHAPVTINHPAEMVDADNWGDLAVGEVGEGVLRDGEWLAVPLIVKDAKGIEVAGSTHKEISMGYTAELKDAPDGADYDLDMTNIRFNHLALVPKGRAGSQARIGDSADQWGATPVIQDKEVKMDIKTIVVGDKAVQVAASDADTVTQILKDHTAKVAELNATIEARDTTIGELKAENAETAKQVMSDAEIAAAVVARKLVTDKAAEFNAEFKDEGQSLADIKREAVRGVYGDEAVADEVSDAEINGIFRVMTPKKVNDAARDMLKEGKEKAKPKGEWDGMFKKKGDK
ncbi:MAG: DUF2213 domain-containing protein [Gammaproteobacteria bacterium]|nr:DUF2213 domain-containing protein [Gammaproteobacteria bacterium]